jgi:beta-mannanase
MNVSPKKNLLIKPALVLLFLAGILLVGNYAFKHKNLIDLLKGPDKNTFEPNLSSPVLAVFSFQPGAHNHLSGSFPHFTLKLKDTRHWTIDGNEMARIPDSIPIMITVETWGGRYFSVDKNPAEDLVNGKFDFVIKQLCTQLIGTRPNVYFRLNPEMEVPAGFYPWQRSGPADKAYEHFYRLCRAYAPQVKQVWGPAGYPGVMETYPGDSLVDAASVILKSASEMQLDVYPKNYPVAYDLMRRLHRLRFISKPIFVFGSKQVVDDSVNEALVSRLTQHMNQERDVVYSPENFRRPASPAKPGKIEIGLYDPQSLLNNDKSVTVEHLFVDFGSLHDGTFQKRFNEVVARGHHVIVTFEPFHFPDGNDDQQVLRHVSDGKYDDEINKLYAILTSTHETVYLRFAHEMEIPITRYPWQSQDPVTYIKSFRYFMNFRKPMPSNFFRVWGPAGDRGSLEWWPGNDAVDFISFAIYGLPDKNITDPNKQESFSTIFYRKYWRFRFVDKPFFITEFGVKGPGDYQTKWLEDAARVIRKNPQVIGVNYFNMSDTPKAWGNIKPPDWSISPETFHRFLDALNK